VCGLSGLDVLEGRRWLPPSPARLFSLALVAIFFLKGMLATFELVVLVNILNMKITQSYRFRIYSTKAQEEWKC
jgi:hypothetical protein